MAKRIRARKSTLTRSSKAAAPRAGARQKPLRSRTDSETEERILNAARTVFMRRGTAGARMQEIAAEAGVNQALLHYYFRSKDRLSSAVFGQFASRLFPALMQTLGGDSSIDEKIERIFAIYLDNLSRNPFLPGYVISELHHHPERIQQMLASVAGAEPGQVLPPLFRKLGRQIDERVRAGTMRPIAPEQFAVNLISLCIFPFVARPMLSIIFGMDDDAFARFIAKRKTELPQFFRNAIRP